ncbi:MAG: transcription antitermination factor NusB [Candidatus Omnitrophica bacterium]|nr:transcription antitermination factor NusB [Candidatus Omnitrophota bacterium]
MRRVGREYALKILYMLDIKEEKDVDNFDFFWGHFNEKEEVKKFAEEIVKGVLSNIKKIDDTISNVSLNWDIKRMSYIDRNILRIGTYEILFRDDIPSVVSINEGIELAKKYGDEDSPKFVNGILHKIKEISEQEGVK